MPKEASKRLTVAEAENAITGGSHIIELGAFEVSQTNFSNEFLEKLTKLLQERADISEKGKLLSIVNEIVLALVPAYFADQKVATTFVRRVVLSAREILKGRRSKVFPETPISTTKKRRGRI